MRLFDACDPAIAEKDCVGRTFQGRIIRTGKSVFDVVEWGMIRPLGLVGFGWGKRFKSLYEGDNIVIDWLRTVYVPFPGAGVSQITDARWRNQVTATIKFTSNACSDVFVKLLDTPDRTVLFGPICAENKTIGWCTISLDTDVPL